MPDINLLKQLGETETPVLLFEAKLPSGDVQRWCTHGLLFNAEFFEARVLHHNLFDLQLSADDAMDGISRLSLVLANADSALSELNSSIGLKGTQLTVYFAFADLTAQSVVTESTVLFRGVAGDPDEITESTLQLSFTNKLSLQRIPIPEVRVQRTCPWNFPSSAAQRVEALSGDNQGRYSHFARCGYSPDQVGGVGNNDPNGMPYVSCDKTRAGCQTRGMFNIDNAGNVTRRFGGFEYVPSAVNVRTAGDKTSHLSPVLSNTAKYNDPVPVVYGTGWLKAPIIFSRNDGNNTHMEVLLGLGPINNLLKVVVNDVEIPLATAGQDMSSTGWYRVFNAGARQGAFNTDFVDAAGTPAGDPYGSIAAMSVVVPNRISSGTSLPTVEVLLQGLSVAVLDATGAVADTTYSNNPAWIILDILRRCGWSWSELNLQSFFASAEFCQTLIESTDLNGNPIRVQRYQTNLVITKRQSAASVVRGIRVSASLMLRYGASGLLELLPETTLAQQQDNLPDGSNAAQSLDGGWPAYEFSDGSSSFSGIVRDNSGASTVRLTSRSVAECSNRLSVEFQDEENEYQQDSLSVVDSGDSSLLGYEISSQSAALGIPNYNQAMRVLLRQLDKTLRGNLFVEFQTSFRALKVRPGDIITLTYLKEGFQRFPFRVVKLSPSMNYAFVTVTAQIHNDDWYSDDINVLRDAGRQPSSHVSTPRPLIGLNPSLDPNSGSPFDLDITEKLESLPDGTAIDLITVGFSQPTAPSSNAPRVPLVSLAPQFGNGGTLAGQSSYYYAVSSVDAAGSEGPLSFTVLAQVNSVTNDNTVTLQGLSLPANAVGFHVYRGASPQVLYRIASAVPVSNQFVDTGLVILPIAPPDPNFDHANVYYRYENLSASVATSATAKSLLASDLGATPGAYKGMVLRIVSGKGRGQERSIADNTATSFTLTTAWSIIPDNTSSFVVCDAAWQFAAVTNFSPVQFAVPYRAGNVLQICARSANVYNQECALELSPVTRHALGQNSADAGVPGVASFVLQASGGGMLAISNLGFTDSSNVASISSGTLNLFWDDLNSSGLSLKAPVAALDSSATFLGAPTPGTLLQIGSETIYIQNFDSTTSMATIIRGQLGSSVSAHPVTDPVTLVQNGKQVVPFAPGFFQNRSSINLIHSFSLPDVRIIAAQFNVTNGFGDGQAQTISYLGNGSHGLRTLFGGQLTTQVSGYLATQASAAPPILVQANHAIRDVRVTLGQASTGYDTVVNLFQNSTLLCSLTIQAGKTMSQVIDGATLAILQKDSLVTLNVASALNTGSPSPAVPARDLTAIIRL